MKALKSELAKRVLADPGAREQLRELAAAGESRPRDAQGGRVIELRDARGRVQRLTATVVRKAA